MISANLSEWWQIQTAANEYEWCAKVCLPG